MIDTLLHGIEKISGFLFNWAWKLRRKGTPPEEWIREYRRWRKATKVAGLLTDPKSTLKDAKKLLDEI